MIMITIKSKVEIKIMKVGGRILADIMDEIKKKVQVGITTKELDRAAESLIFKSGGTPAFKGYENFPSTLCASVNQVIVHGVPSDYKLKQGDILSLDLGIKYKGFFTDMAVTLPVKNYRNQTSVNFEAMRLIRVTKKALKFAIKKSKPGNTFGDIGNTIQRYVESQGFNVVRELCGHGIGKELHEEPQVLNYGKRHKGEVLKEGMTFCIEPMVTVGDWHIKKSSDGFGWETRDGSLSCHFEVTVAIGKKGAFVLTKI
ncbi:MAG TPA: type I methionyl aminopeptidase [Candidatus Atribacteria bacterium]|nr:type I methionyl aminopeptidase [Candidatus Atribacteria bacterium]